MRIFSDKLYAQSKFLLSHVLLLLINASAEVNAQELNNTQGSSPSPIKISETPKTIDPVVFVPVPLAKKVTVTFEGEQFKKVMSWLQQEANIKLNVDYKSLASVKLIETDPVFEALDDAPLYMLLSRLEMLGVGWYMEDNALQITSRNESLNHDVMVSYNLGDLLDAGYLPHDLLRTMSFLSG